MDITEDNLLDVYHPRNPQASDYYRYVEAHFEDLEMVWEDRYERFYGFWRPYVMDVIHRYPWPRPGLVCQLLGTVFLAINRHHELKMELVAPGRAGVWGFALNRLLASIDLKSTTRVTQDWCAKNG